MSTTNTSEILSAAAFASLRCKWDIFKHTYNLVIILKQCIIWNRSISWYRSSFLVFAGGYEELHITLLANSEWIYLFLRFISNIAFFVTLTFKCYVIIAATIVTGFSLLTKIVWMNFHLSVWAVIVVARLRAAVKVLIVFSLWKSV